MGRDEQIEEREVLDSIFPDEITGEATRLLFFPPLSFYYHFSLFYSHFSFFYSLPYYRIEKPKSRLPFLRKITL